MSWNWNADPADTASVRAWLATWQGLVQTVDFVPARDLIDERVVGFGTKADVVEGRDNLETNQWRGVWPTIEEFGWDLDGMRVGVSPDRLMAFLITTFTSTGFNEDGSTFSRGGRTTVILSRDALDASWQGVHTHLSLNAGTPGKSHGNRPTRS